MRGGSLALRRLVASFIGFRQTRVPEVVLDSALGRFAFQHRAGAAIRDGGVVLAVVVVEVLEHARKEGEHLPVRSAGLHFELGLAVVVLFRFERDIAEAVLGVLELLAQLRGEICYHVVVGVHPGGTRRRVAGQGPRVWGRVRRGYRAVAFHRRGRACATLFSGR